MGSPHRLDHSGSHGRGCMIDAATGCARNPADHLRGIKIPGNCSVRVSIDSIRAAATGGWPAPPPGAWIWYSPNRSYYNWDIGRWSLAQVYAREPGPGQDDRGRRLKNFVPFGQRCNRADPFRVELRRPARSRWSRRISTRHSLASSNDWPHSIVVCPRKSDEHALLGRLRDSRR